MVKKGHNGGTMWSIGQGAIYPFGNSKFFTCCLNPHESIISQMEVALWDHKKKRFKMCGLLAEDQVESRTKQNKNKQTCEEDLPKHVLQLWSLLDSLTSLTLDRIWALPICPSRHQTLLRASRNKMVWEDRACLNKLTSAHVTWQGELLFVFLWEQRWWHSNIDFKRWQGRISHVT